MELKKINQKALKKAIKIINSGGVIVYPTDTVYGLIADATNKKAVEKIFKIKKRPKTKPLALFVSDIKQAKELANINKEQEAILKKHWPGKYTFILKTKNRQTSDVRQLTDIGCLSGLVVGEDGTIGIRIPKYKFLQGLLKKVNKPLAQTSANISGKPASTKIRKILNQFKNKIVRTGLTIDLIIDAGNLAKSKPSKVVDLTGKTKKILRY